MAYSTVRMLRQALAPGDWIQGQPAPSQPTHNASDLSDQQLQDAIAEADARIDSYIGGRYATPVQPAPGAEIAPSPIAYWSRDIAAYLATLTKRKNQDLSDQNPVTRRFNLVMADLTAVRAGNSTLAIPPVVDSGSNEGSGAGPAMNPYVGNLFTADDFGIGACQPNLGWPDGHWQRW